jgi:PAS domain S-box-containing protein
MAGMSEEERVDRVPVERRSDHSRLRTIVERMVDGIVITDHDGVIRFVNPAAESLFGQAADDLVGERFAPPIVRGETSDIEIERGRGDVLHGELRVADFEWEGEPSYLISVRDVTDRKRAAERERQLQLEQSARAEAEAASQAKSEFLAIMSHELRTPLNAVLGYADLLQLGVAGRLSEEQRQQLRRISASGRHLLALVNEVLDLARIEAGRLKVERSPFRAGEVVDAAVVLIQPQAEVRGLHVRRVDASSEALAIGDPDRVRQIVVNLLANAVKFTPAGGEVTIAVGEADAPDIPIRPRGDSAWVFVRVVDTGPGIASDQLETIFAPFVQAQSGHTRHKDGTGLGLTISRRLARLMNGDLTVRSQLGHGAEFTLWLPQAVELVQDRGVERELALRGREPAVKGLAEVGEALLRDLEPVLDAFVARLRESAPSPAARTLHFSQLADHTPVFIADVAETLVVLEESGGEPSSIIADGTEIRRLVAERHGAQRGRLGWTADGLRAEHAMLREEIERAIQHRFLGETGGRIAEAIRVVAELIAHAEAHAVRALTRALAVSS